MKNNRLFKQTYGLLLFLAGVTFLLLLGAFTRDWTESTPTDDTVANQIDDYNRYLRVDASDRLKEMIYGFTAGENSGNPGIKELIFKQQAAAPGTPNADEITLYSIDDGTNCGLYAIQEDGYTKQLLKKVGTDINFVIETADIPADLIDSAHYAAGSIDAEHLAADIIDETKIADDGIDSEHYNDGSVDAVHLANVDPDSFSADNNSSGTNKAVNGLMFAWGTGTVAGNNTVAVAHGLTRCFRAFATYSDSDAEDQFALKVYGIDNTNFTVRSTGSYGGTFNWWAIGR